jgi:hypothetical protein
MIGEWERERIQREEREREREKERERGRTNEKMQRDHAARLMAALPAEVLEGPLVRYQREANELEAARKRERRAAQREQQRQQRTKTVDHGVRVPDDLTVFVAPANWQNEVIASLRTAMGQGDAQVLNDVCDAVFPTLEKLRGAISEGDARVLNTVREAVFPTPEKIAAKLERDINAIGERVDRKLAEMQAEVRSAINKRRAGAVIDLPSPLSKARGLN